MMKPDEILSIVNQYEEKIKTIGVSIKGGVPSEWFPLNRKVGFFTPFEAKLVTLAHCRKMLEQIRTFVTDNKVNKALRRLCFVQGVLWRNGVYTIDELREHTASADD